jgi:hypothetical protein
MDLQLMSDEEILEAVQEAYSEDARLNMNYIDIEVSDGTVTLNGRVSSDEELQIVDEVMTEVLGIDDYRSKVWVDETLGLDDADDSSPDIKEMDFENGDELEESGDFSEGDEDDY